MKFTNKAHQSRWKAIFAARILLIIGLIDIASSTSAPFHKKLALVKKFVPEMWPNLASTGTVIVGVLLMVLSFAVARRSHAAFLLTQLLLLLSVSLHVIKGLFYAQATGSAIMFIFLLIIRHEFYAKPHRTTITRAVIVFSQLALLSFGIGLFLIFCARSPIRWRSLNTSSTSHNFSRLSWVIRTRSIYKS